MVRDPRAMANSRAHITWKKKLPDFNDRLAEGCDRLISNLNFTKTSKWINNNNFIILRYEDVALDYETFLPLLYKFTNIPIDDDNYKTMLNWLKEHTKKDTKRDRGGKWKFDTQRDASEVVSKWKKELDWDTIDFVQKSCGREVLEGFGRYFEGVLERFGG